jgi:phage-related tail protein
MARLASFSVSINVNKKGKVEEPDNQYATGTLSAAPGLALVGENGPELVNFGGGEVVYTAAQTRRILDSRMGAMQGMQNTAVPEVVVNIPAINIDLGRKNRKYEAVEYYTQNLPPENDSPELSSDDFKRLTTLSERETLSKVYQPNITNKIEMTNNISKDADLDEIVHELSMKLIDVMAVTAEGVHD